MESNKISSKDEVKTAFEMYEHVYNRLNNARNNESNEFPVGDINRVEKDLSEKEKEHLALLRTKLTMAIASNLSRSIEESSQSNDRLGKNVFYLNLAMVVLTAVMAVAAVVAL